jgi:putative PEP-CTERM system TPR-repeat lipoprotein
VAEIFLGISLLGAALVVVTPVLGATREATPSDARGPTRESPANASRVSDLLRQSNDASKRGDLRVAILLLKNALQIAPQNATARAQLGVLLMLSGDLPGSERELRQARSDGAPDETVVPNLLGAMLSSSKFQNVLDQFLEPKASDASELAAEILRARAIAFFALGQTAQADVMMDKSLTIRRTPQALLTRADFANKQGDAALAMNLTDEALKLAPTDTSALMMEIGLLQQVGKSQQALTYADQLVQQIPNQAASRVIRIGIFLSLKQDSKAQADADTILTQFPNLPIGLYYRALLRARANDLKGAWEIAQALPPQFTRAQPQIGMGVAEIAVATGNIENALVTLASVVANFPKQEEPRIRLAALRLQQKNPKQALDALEPLKESKNPRAMALLGEVYSALKEYDSALEYFEKANATGLDNDALKTAIALTELQGGKIDQGTQNLVELSNRNPGNAGMAGPLVSVLIQTGRADEAVRVADRLVQNSPKSPIGAFYRGEALIAKRDLDGAGKAFGAALQIDPNFVPALYYRAQVTAAQGKFEPANADLDKILARTPNNTQALIKKAQFALEGGHEEDVVPLLQRAIAASPKDAQAILSLTNYYMFRKKYAEAEALLTSLMRTAPDNYDALAALARVQFARGAYAQSTVTLRQLASALPRSAPAQMLLGDALVANKDNPGAKAAYERAVQLDPSSVGARRSLINFSVVTGDTNRAVSAAREYASSHPGPEADIFVAGSLSLVKRNAEAKALLAKSLAAKPDNRTLLALSQLTRSEGDNKGAEDLLTGWVKTHPKDSAVRMEYGNTLLQAGNMAGAQTQFETVAQLTPNDPAALNNLAWTIQKTDPPRAVQLVTRAAALAPQSGEILDTLAWMKWQQNDRKDVVPLLLRARGLSRDPTIVYHLAVALEGTGKREDAKKALDGLLESGAKFKEIDDARKLATQLH